MSKQVVVYGAGVAGMQVAHALAKQVDVTLVSPTDYFEVPMALPRLLVQPGFAQEALVPVDVVRPAFKHLRGRLVAGGEHGFVVETPDGQHHHMPPAISVLATGSRYATSLTRALAGTLEDRVSDIAAAHARLLLAQRVLIVGGGAVGVEVAGEIATDFPQKSVTLIESGDRLLPGTSDAVAAIALSRLQALGVEVLLRQRIASPGFGDTPAQGGTAATEAGRRLPFDWLFWAVGGTPNTDYLDRTLLDADERVPVDPQLRVVGLNDCFAVGDITNLAEVKKAIYTNSHVKVVVKNVRALLAGREPAAVYTPRTGDNTMLVTLGRTGGVGHMPGLGTVKAGWLMRFFKANGMLTGLFRNAVGAPKRIEGKGAGGSPSKA